MLDEVVQRYNDKIMDICEERECNCDDEVPKKSKNEQCSLLKQSDKINKQNDVSFISNIKFGSDAKRKSEEEYYHIIKQYSQQ